MIRACQRVGLSIAEIRIALAELPEDHIPGAEDWHRLSQRLQRELHDRIDDLNRALHALTQQDPAETLGERAPAAGGSTTGTRT
jgi:MerR family redox-sensitive transcriptional activator SoxR